ncbi:MAG: cytochrome c [Pseudomonadota bacterium]
MKKTLLGVSVIGLAAAVGLSAAVAGDPAVDRQTMMKNVGASMRVAAGMVRGKIPFDALVAEMAMRTMNSTALGYPAMFPQGSESGADTEAGPGIWSDAAGFAAASDAFADASGKAAEAAKGGADSFKGAFGAVAKNCKACHEKFRVKKN